jgi:hypothetical protein
MVNVPSVPEIITVNSEALQTQIRDLLPSQNGFGSELQASNVITPIIDLTTAAEGTTTPVDLQSCYDFGSSHNEIANTTTVIINSVGFFLVSVNVGIASPASGTANSASITMNDGATTKTLFKYSQSIGASDRDTFSSQEFIIWCKTGMSVSGVTNSADTILNVTTRAIADSEGKLLNPDGYPL